MTPPAPIRFSPAVEQPEPDEAETGQSLVNTMRKISEITYRDGGHALRSVHAKSHGFVEGELEVLPNLPPTLRKACSRSPVDTPS